MGEAIRSRRTMVTTRKGVTRKAREMEEAEARLMRRDREDASPPRKRVKEVAERQRHRDRKATPPRRREREATPPKRSKDREATRTRRSRDRHTTPRRNQDKDTTPPRRSLPRRIGDTYATSLRSRDREATLPVQKRVKEAKERRDRNATPPRRRGRKDTPPRRNKDKDTTPPRNSRERESTSPRHSSEREATTPRHSRDKVATPPRHMYREATPPLHREREATLPLGRVEHNSKSDTMETWKLKDLWKVAIPVEAGLYKMDSQQEEFKWDFSNLEQAFEENGKLYHEIVGNKNKVYLFGIVERHDWIQDKVAVPVVVAVASSSPPSDEVNVRPVELDGEGGGEETRIPMRQLKMDWIPGITPELERFERSPCVFVLGSTRSTTTLENSNNEDHIAKFQSFVPCLDHQTQEEEHYQCRLQCEMDELAKNIISETIEIDEELPPVLKAGLKEYVADKLFLAKRKHRQSYRERVSNTQKEGTRTTKDSENMGKLYKFYPVPTLESPDISKTKYPFHGYYCEQEAESKVSLCDLAASIC